MQRRGAREAAREAHSSRDCRAVPSAAIEDVTAPATRVDLTLTKAELDQAASAGISVPLDVPVSNQVQKVRVIVLDPKLQALGSVTIPTK